MRAGSRCSQVFQQVLLASYAVTASHKAQGAAACSCSGALYAYNKKNLGIFSRPLIRGQNEHLARANKAPDGPNHSSAWPRRGLPRHFDFPAGQVGGFRVHGSTGGATGMGFGLLYFDWRSHIRQPLVINP
jgi:hypothetical protein